MRCVRGDAQGIQGVPIPRRIWAAVGIALCGLVLFTDDPSGSSSASLTGDLACVGAAVFYALYDLRLFVWGKRVTPLRLITNKVGAQAAVSLTLLLVFGFADTYEFANTASTAEIATVALPILWSGVVVNGVAPFLQVGGQQAIGPARAQVICERSRPPPRPPLSTTSTTASLSYARTMLPPCPRSLPHTHAPSTSAHLHPLPPPSPTRAFPSPRLPAPPCSSAHPSPSLPPPHDLHRCLGAALGSADRSDLPRGDRWSPGTHRGQRLPRRRPPRRHGAHTRRQLWRDRV